MEWGTAIHSGLAAWYDPELWLTPLSEQRAEAAFAQSMREFIGEPGTMDELLEREYQDFLILGKRMLQNYAAYSRKYDAPKFKPVLAEYKFSVPILALTNNKSYIDPATGLLVMYEGRIDLLVQMIKTGHFYLVDHKTTSTMDDNAHLPVDTQISSYAWAMTQLGFDVRGFIYNELLKAAPNPPNINKNGSISVDKRQQTTAELVLHELDMSLWEWQQRRTKLLNDLGEGYGVVTPYDDYIQWLLDNPKQFIRRTEVHRTPKELAQQGRLIYDEMLDMSGSPRIYPNPTKMNCRYCAFQGPCQVETELGDPEFVLATGPYVQRPEDY